MLRPIADTFNPQDYPDLLVGLTSPDDAAVWRLDDERAIILTTDFFTPVVDDAYDYGAIAAANSLSDVYAMGGKPFLALNVAALPPDLPSEIGSEIMRGGADKAKEAGVVIAGGHTVRDKEPKYGLVVVGFVDPKLTLSKSGIRPGDRLVLTKPLGFGVTTTALKRQQAAPEDVAEVVGWMKKLNKVAGQLASELGLRGGTDITGYSLLGHGWEMASASGVGLRLEFERIPFVSCARKYADLFTFPGGAYDNREFFNRHLKFDPRLSEAQQMLLFDPQTSGGLLLAVPPEKLDRFRQRAAELNQPVWEIGEAFAGDHIEVE
ncbi:selenophosphate synthase [Longilinea arvoryzae]|uniref:Selenophosphate synthase n=1 Tax=Longilinea arvoryzae TaxID=360412 RepID=A0A0S7BC04_9CHLR|nr:selenophosphate synthase [Longilinea arvoryzae]